MFVLLAEKGKKCFGGYHCYNKSEAELTVKLKRGDFGWCRNAECAGLPFTSQLKLSLLASLLLLSCDETDGFAAAICIVV